MRGGFGTMMGRTLFPKLDINHDGTLTHDEFRQTFHQWFESWNTGQTGQLTADELRKGINQDMMPFPPGGPGGPGGRANP